MTFLRALAPQESHFNFRSFLEAPGAKGGPLRHDQVSLAEVPALLERCAREQRGLFVVANSGGQRSEDIIVVRAVFLDIDRKDFDTDAECEQAMRLAHEGRLSRHDASPSNWPHATAVVSSGGGGYHLYWAVRDCDLDRFKTVQRALADRFGGDRSVSDLPRVMRLSGSLHWKTGQGIPVELRSCKPERSYSLGDLLQRLDVRVDDDVHERRQTRQPSSTADPSQDVVWNYLLANRQWLKPGGRQSATGPIDVICPNAESHSLPDSPTSTTYWAEGVRGKVRGFKCQHAGCLHLSLRDWLVHIGFETNKACLPLAKDDGALCEFDRWLHDEGHHVYCTQGRWLIFDGARLKQDTMGVKALIKGFAGATYTSAAQAVLKDSEDGKAVSRAKAALALLDQRRQDSLLAASSVAFRWQGNPLDSRIDELCCPNGVVDLRTGDLLPAHPSQGHTLMAGVAYDPDATAPQFEDFLLRALPDTEIRSYVQRLAGYWLTGQTTEEMFSLLVGGGGNGKGTLLDTIAAVMGEYAHAGGGELMLSGKRTPGAASADLVAAIGKRLVYGNESEDGQRLSEAQVKRLASTGKMTARPLYGEPIEFEATFKLCLSSNYLPEIKDATDGTWRRLQPIPFEHQLVRKSGERELKAILREELSGVLAWMVRGATKWYRDGLCPPPLITRATEEYRAEADDIAVWLKDRIESGGFTPTRDLLDDYIQSACIKHPPTVEKFGRELAKRGLKKITDGKRRGFRASLTRFPAEHFL